MKRTGVRAVEAKILATAYDRAVGLQRAGMITNEALNEFEQACLGQPPSPAAMRLTASTRCSTV